MPLTLKTSALHSREQTKNIPPRMARNCLSLWVGRGANFSCGAGACCLSPLLPPSTPPSPRRRRRLRSAPRELQSHLHAGDRAEQRQIVDVAEMADPKNPVLENPETVAEAHVEPPQNQRAQSVGAMALSETNSRQRRRSSPSAQGTAVRLRPPAPKPARLLGSPRRDDRAGRKRSASPLRQASPALPASRAGDSWPECTGNKIRNWPRASAASPNSCAQVWPSSMLPRLAR